MANPENSGCLDPAGNPESRFPHPEVRLFPSKPNPFNPRTTIVFDIPDRMAISLGVFDLSGRLVRTLITGEHRETGRHEVVWNGRDDAGRQLSSGAYFYRLEAGPHSETMRMVLIK